MNELPPISHQWTEEDRLRLIYRIAHTHYWYLRNKHPIGHKIDHSKQSSSLIMSLAGDDANELEAMRDIFDEYLTEGER